MSLYLSRSKPASAAARSRLLLQPMTGIAPRWARASATAPPRPPEPPGRMTDLPFIPLILFHVHASDETGIQRLPGQWLQFFTQFRPPAFGKRRDRCCDFHFRQLE